MTDRDPMVARMMSERTCTLLVALKEPTPIDELGYLLNAIRSLPGVCDVTARKEGMEHWTCVTVAKHQLQAILLRALEEAKPTTDPSRMP